MAKQEKSGKYPDLKKSCGFKVYKRKEHEHDGKRRIGGTLVKKNRKDRIDSINNIFFNPDPLEYSIA